MMSRECSVTFDTGAGINNLEFNSRSTSILNLNEGAITWDYSTTLFDIYTDFNVTMYNMKDDTIQKLSRGGFNDKRTGITIATEGYDGKVFKVATGEVYWVEDTRRIGMRETLFRCTTLLTGIDRETVNLQIKSNTTFKSAVERILDGRVGVNFLQKSVGIETMPSNYTAKGRIIKVINDFCRAHGLIGNIKNGQMIISKRHPPKSLTTDIPVFLLEPDTGLIDYPYRLDWNNWKVTSLFNPRLFPGQWIKVYSPGAGQPFDALLPSKGVSLYIVGVEHIWDDTEASTILKLVDDPSNAYNMSADRSL